MPGVAVARVWRSPVHTAGAGVPGARAVITAGKDANGKRKRKVFTAVTRHEVAEQLPRPFAIRSAA